jgi:serine/threonine protein kinase
VSTDLFAVGVMLYELLCDGHHPYPDSKPRIGEHVIDPRTFRSDLNSDLAELLIKACAPERGHRFITALEMKTVLESVR